MPDYRPPNPGDETQNFILRLRSGDDSELLTEEDEEDVAADDAALQQLRSNKEEEERWPERKPEAAPAPAAPAMPPALAKLIGTDAEDELMAVARFLDVRNKKKLTLVFHTPIGDVKCPVNWSSTESSQLHRSRHLLLILVRSSESMFVPRPGSELEISFWEHRDQPRLRVICLAPPMQLVRPAEVCIISMRSMPLLVASYQVVPVSGAHSRRGHAASEVCASTKGLSSSNHGLRSHTSPRPIRSVW